MDALQTAKLQTSQGEGPFSATASGSGTAEAWFITKMAWICMNGICTTSCFPFWTVVQTNQAVILLHVQPMIESYHRVRWEEAVILSPLQRPMPPKDANGADTKDRKSSKGILVE